MPHCQAKYRVSALCTSLAILVSSLIMGQRAAAVPAYTMEERAFAIAGPSLVYVEFIATGFLRRKGTGEALHTVPMSLSYTCSGFVVDANGYVATSTHCVQPSQASVLGSATNHLTADRLKVGQLTTAQKDAFVRDVLATAEFTGESPGSKPSLKIYGQLFQGQGGLTTEPAGEAEVIDSLPANDGDVTLLKLNITGVPVAEISQDPVNTNVPVVLLAFGSDGGSPTYTARYKVARIGGRFGTKTPATYQMDADLGTVSHGGMIVDSSGRVVGLINADLGSKDKLNRLVTHPEYVTNMLTKAGGKNSLANTDSLYRAALNDYFGGRYRDAIRKFDQVLGVMPEHALATVYRKQATDRMAIEGDASAENVSWLLILVIALGAALLLCALTIIILLVRRRARPVAVIGPYAPVSGFPVSTLPVSTVPVSTTPVSGGPMGSYDQPYYSGRDGIMVPEPLRADPNSPQFAWPAEPLIDPDAPTRRDLPDNPWGPPAR
jgi:Trypsin-like peptidase domain